LFIYEYAALHEEVIYPINNNAAVLKILNNSGNYTNTTGNNN